MDNRAGSLLPKGGHTATRTELKQPSIMNKHKVKHHRNSDTKTGKREPHQSHRLGTVKIKLLGASFTRATPSSVAEIVPTFIWLFGSHDNPLTRQ